MLSNLDHANIVRFLCACTDPDNLCIVTEYMEMSLFEALHVRELQFTSATKLALMVHVWRGLYYLHAKGVAHCDVKPQNVLLSNVINVYSGADRGESLRAKEATIMRYWGLVRFLYIAWQRLNSTINNRNLSLNE